MKTPTWALVMGILMMAFGGCSVINDMQTAYMPDMLEMQQDMMEGFSKNMNSFVDSTQFADSSDLALRNSQNEQVMQNMEKTMNKMFHISDYTKTWMVRFGYIGAMVSILYILGGVFLLVKKNYSIKLVYGVLVVSILFAVLKGYVLSSEEASGLIALSTGFSQMFGVVIDIIFLVVIASSDKTAYATVVEIDND